MLDSEATTKEHAKCEPCESKVPVTVGRVVNVYSSDGWKPKYEHTGHNRHEVKAGIVVASFGTRANVRVFLDSANDHAEQPRLENGQAMSVQVFESMSDEQRENYREKTNGLWAEWPRRV